MFHHFQQSEFYTIHYKSWLQQFKYAMSIRKSSPTIALRFLVDTDLERWNIICEQIADIRDVYIAIEFLGEQMDTLTKCCKPKHSRIETTIRVITSAGYARYKKVLEYEIQSLDQLNDVRTQELDIVEDKLGQLIEKQIAMADSMASDKNNMIREIKQYKELQQVIDAFKEKERELKSFVQNLEMELRIKRRILKNIVPY